MEFSTMTNDQLRAYLDEQGVDHSSAKVKADFVQLAEGKAAELAEPEQNDEPEHAQPTSVLDTVKSAIKIERTETKKVEDTSYLADRDYSQLSVGERALIREQSPEYENQTEGVKVKVTDRLAAAHRIVKLADKHYAKLRKGETYTLSQVDYDAMKNVQVKVKTEATKDKCCGQAKYETVNLLELSNG